MDIVLIAEQLAGNSFTAVYMYLVNVVFAGSIILNCGSDSEEGVPSEAAQGELQFSLPLPNRKPDRMHVR